jgi:hypothetical protein
VRILECVGSVCVCSRLTCALVRARHADRWMSIGLAFIDYNDVCRSYEDVEGGGSPPLVNVTESWKDNYVSCCQPPSTQKL